MMKEIPILFSTPMVRAILNGRKTMTRRIVKFPKMYKLNELLGWEIKPHKDAPHQFSFWWETKYTIPVFKCPYGKPGDVLWVREKFADISGMGFMDNSGLDMPISYYADVSKEGLSIAKDYGVKWKPSIHMPKSACRIWLEVVSVKVERLHEITEQDAEAEGAEAILCGPVYCCKCGFTELWQSINGPDSWNANPWVWVIEFKRTNPPTP